MNETTQTYFDAVRMVAAVIGNGNRIDRYLRIADDGHYYTTPDKTYLTNNGQETPPYVSIPVGGSDDDDIEEWAGALLQELDEIVASNG